MNTIKENLMGADDLKKLAPDSGINTSTENLITGQTGWTHPLVTSSKARIHEIGDHTIATRNRLIAESISEYLATAPQSRM